MDLAAFLLNRCCFHIYSWCGSKALENQLIIKSPNQGMNLDLPNAALASGYAGGWWGKRA